MVRDYVSESVNWGSDPRVSIDVYAPAWYKRGHAHDDLYTQKILAAKDNSRDESPFFLPFVEKMLEELIQIGKIPEEVGVVVVPSSDGCQRLTLVKVGERIAERLGGQFKTLIGKSPSGRRNKGITTAEEKRERTKGKFRLCGQKPSGVILVLDDQKTTGSTFTECNKILLEGGAEEIHCISLGINRNVELLGE